MSTTLYYIHDPLCSWCYAFQPVLAILQKQLPPSVIMEKVVGGLAPDSQEPMPDAMQKYIQTTWRKIEQTVPGIHFNFDFWRNNTPIRSTYPACRAVLAAKRQGVVYEDKIISALQNAYYQQAQNPALTETLSACAQQSGLNVEQFNQDLISPDIEQQLTEQLQLTQSLQVTSFPSLRLVNKETVAEVPIDYLNYQTMLAVISSMAIKQP